ncbi:MAG: DUF2336 domain-containing protein [Proteobacteria bacterium]|nr:DUF2336 domain-containing protein [Pseudomonadota bacterium]
MLEWVLGRKSSDKTKSRSGGKKHKKPPYQESKRIAAEGDVKSRVKLASIEDLDPEFLYFFTSDKAADVRRAVAKNDGTPLQADLILARDVDPMVREELAYKIGKLVPSLTPDENEQLVEMSFQVLEILALDQLPRIRIVIAEEIKHLDNVPKRIVDRLAIDAVEAVAGPILEYSPLLTEEQLLQIIASGIKGGALDAVARRRNLPEKVSRAVVGREVPRAIGALLTNSTATIGEKLMGEIAMVAEGEPDLHLPLVNRANLSASTMKRIAMFVSSNLLDTLIAVNGLKEERAKELRLAVRSRIDGGASSVSAERAENLHAAGQLDDLAVLDAIDDTDREFLNRALALLSELPDNQVEKMLSSESSKAICGLAWKCGLSADIAVSLQRRIGNIPAKSMIHENKNGSFAMPEEELKWYVEYFA